MASIAGIDGSRLKSFIERVENMDAEIAALKADRQELFREVKAAGLDDVVVRRLIKHRAQTEETKEKNREREDLLDAYLRVLGDTPLEAAARRAAEGEGDAATLQ